jgi:hypothetical protein
MNPYEYETAVPWMPEQRQLHKGDVSGRSARAPFAGQPRQQGDGQKPKKSERMPRERALALARRLKKGLALASVVSFATFSGLVAFHQAGTTTTATASHATSGSTRARTATATPASTPSSTSFLHQQGGNNFGSSSSTQGSSSGSSSTGQAPASGTGVS